VFFSWINIANATVVINEIQLTPTVERFIELYNSSSSPVDLTDWYIQRKTASGDTFGSLVSKTYFLGKSIDAGGYFLISRTSINNPDIIVDNLTLTESNTIQIKNLNQEIVDIVEWESIPEGESTQKNSSGDWDIDSPTPGEKNEGSESLNENNNLNIENNTNVLSSPISSNQEESLTRKITAKIITPKIVFARIPFFIEPLIVTNKKETLNFGKFKWNFGDGTVGESNNLNSLEHIYYYPGEYVVSLDYSEQYNFKLDASARVILKVVSSEIVISSIGFQGDAFIELENKSKYEMILSKWIITAGVRSFIIPEGTVILSKNKLKLSPRITGFTSNDLNLIIITDLKGEVMTIYPIQEVKPQKIVAPASNFYKKTVSPEEGLMEESPLIIDLNDLAASAGGSKGDIKTSAYAYWGLGGIIFIGSMSVIFFRRRNDLIDYLEEEIRAEDMTIIE